MSDSVRPQRRQPTRLPRPWDSLGKNTAVSCHFLLQCRKVKSESEVTQSCPTLGNPMNYSLPGSSVHGIFQARVLEWGAIMELYGDTVHIPASWCWWLRRQRICLQRRRPGFNPWVGKIPWSRKWQPIPVSLPGESHGQRSLVGYSLWGHKESDTTEQLTFSLYGALWRYNSHIK